MSEYKKQRGLRRLTLFLLLAALAGGSVRPAAAESGTSGTSTAESSTSGTAAVESGAAGASAAESGTSGTSAAESGASGTAAVESGASETAGEDGESGTEENSNPAVINAWGYVDYAMDVSGGIPADATGRLGRIRDKGVLTVATEPYYAPQEFIDPSLPEGEQYVGSDIELAKRIAGRMGVELRIVPLDFTNVLEMTKSGRYDLAISGLAYTPGRASTMTLSKGYHYSETASTCILIREEDKDRIRSLEDLAREDIVAQSSSLQEMLFAENIKLYNEFRRLSSMSEVYREVEEGRAAAAAADLETARMYLKNNPDSGLMMLEGVTFSLGEQYQGDRVAAASGCETLIAYVNGVIDEVVSSGEYEAWFDKYSEYAAELGL